MPAEFVPKLSILGEPQRRLWEEMSSVPDYFVLCGETAVALHLEHRESVDFDLFGDQAFDPDALYDVIPFLVGSEVIRKADSTLACLVERGKPIKILFFGIPSIRLTKAPHIAPDIGLKVASLIDSSGLEAAVVQKRAEAKDYLDMDAIIQLGKIDLSTALAVGRSIYGSKFNPANTLKSLCFFEDGDLQSLPQDVRDRLVAAVAAVDLNQLPDIGPEKV